MRVTIADIQAAVAREHGLDPAIMREPAPVACCGVNTRDKAHPRQVAMALSALLTEHSITRIGHFFGGRDRSTVYHALRVVAERRRSDARLHTTLRRVTLELCRR